MDKSMGAIDIIRTNFRLSANSQNHNRSISWATRIISGIAQGVGLLALIQLANTWASRQEESTHNATPWILTLIVTAIIGAISIYIRDRFSYEGAFSVMRSVHRRVGDQLAKLPLGWFSTDTTGRLSRLGAATVNELGNLSAHLLTELSAATVTLLTLLTGLLWWYPALGSIFALCLICYLILMWALTYLDSAASAYAAPAATELADRIVEFSTCQSMLRACDQTIYPQMDTALAENRRRSTRRLWVECIGNFLGGIASQTICVVMIISSVHLAFTGSLAPLAVVAVIGISLEITHYLSTISNCRTGLLAVGPTMATINEVLDARPLPEPETSLPQPLPHQVELREVDFAYGKDKQVLNKVSFTVAPHTMTALVGPSGAGKTTIARLICRFWDVNSGAVLVGDRDVRELTTEDLMSQISMVFQDVYLFDDTLEANIRIGNSNATKEALLHAAELAGVNDIV
ncbi:ABC transporter ATP-binding protein, partial [Varibaculum cambriense]